MHPLWGRRWALANYRGDRAATYPSPMRGGSGRGQWPLLTDGKVGQRRKAAVSEVLVCEVPPTPIWSPEVFVKPRIGPTLLSYLGNRGRMNIFSTEERVDERVRYPLLEWPWAVGEGNMGSRVTNYVAPHSMSHSVLPLGLLPWALFSLWLLQV